MKYFWKKHKTAIVIWVFLLVFPALFYLAFMSVMDRIQAKADSIQEKRIDAELDKAKIDKIPQMEEANEAFEKNKAAVGVILGTEHKVDFIEYMETLAQDTGNKIELKVLSENAGDDPVQSKKSATVAKSAAQSGSKSIEDQLPYKQYISMQVNLEGSYSAYLQFLHKLENSNYYTNIISFDLQKVFLEKETDQAEKKSPNGIFLSPSNGDDQSQPADTPSDDQSILKSSLNIVVYTE